jgi:putative tryptophan/tyrosine transport system substrate-binding protein
MRRRAFILFLSSGAILWALSARAQQGSKLYRLGYLAQHRVPSIETLQASLRELGYVEGQNLKLEYRFGGSEPALDALATELVALGPDAIVTVGTPPALAAKRATTSIPIVMGPINDPLRAGIVASLARPRAKTSQACQSTGPSSAASVWRCSRTPCQESRASPFSAMQRTFSTNICGIEDAQLAARALEIEPRLFTVREPAELGEAFAAMQQSGANAVFVLADTLFWSVRHQIIALAAEHRFPAMYEEQEFVVDGGLTSYGPKVVELIRRSAVLVDKILKGAKPGDLPIERPTTFELVINLKTARALGITIPTTLLARADEVIE